MSALIFDLDGTLVESLPGIAASLNRSLNMHGLKGHGHTAVRSFIGDGAKMLIKRAAPAGSDASLLESLLKNFAADYGVSWSEGTFVYPGLKELLADLKKDRRTLAVLSNKPHPFTVEIVDSLFPPDTFDITLGNREDLPHKPDPTGALEIADALGVTPEECTIIGDSTMDLDTAKNAGMKSIAVLWGYHDQERLSYADQVVADVNELAESLQSAAS